LEKGSQLRLLGICSIRVSEFGTPADFRVHLRNTGDITVVARPSWLTIRRQMSLL